MQQYTPETYIHTHNNNNNVRTYAHIYTQTYRQTP